MLLLFISARAIFIVAFLLHFRPPYHIGWRVSYEVIRRAVAQFRLFSLDCFIATESQSQNLGLFLGLRCIDSKRTFHPLSTHRIDQISSAVITLSCYLYYCFLLLLILLILWYYTHAMPHLQPPSIPDLNVTYVLTLITSMSYCYFFRSIWLVCFYRIVLDVNAMFSRDIPCNATNLILLQCNL